MPVTRASLVWLFDVDGTLLLTQGAGRDALSLALRDQFGVEDDLSGIPFAGRTDTLILADVLTRHGLEFRDGERERFWGRVTAHMRALMDPPRGGLLPGVRPLLDTIGAEPGWVRALLTGNVAEMARIKLEAFDVYDAFAWGAFGDEAVDRNELAKLAVRRAAERHGVTPERARQARRSWRSRPGASRARCWGHVAPTCWSRTSSRCGRFCSGFARRR